MFKSAQRGDEIRYTVSVINSGDIATAGNVKIQDYLDKAGSHVPGSTEARRNGAIITPAATLDALDRSTYWLETTAEGIPTLTVTSLLPGDVIIVTYSVLIDEVGTPLFNNELHNTATATYDLNSQTITQRSDICTVNVNYSYLLANKRGRAQGHDLSNLYYVLELTNDGTSAASDIVITENFPKSFQPNSGPINVKKDIAIINYMRHPNTIQNVIEKVEGQKTIAKALYDELNANYYRLKAQLQDVLAEIAKLSGLTEQQQQELIYDTAVAVIPELKNSQALAETAYNRLFEPTVPELGYESIYAAIETLSKDVQGANTNATNTPLPAEKDKRASYVCDAHGGGITLLDLCDLANDAITMNAVVNRYIVTIAVYLQRHFLILGMEKIHSYEQAYAEITQIAADSRTKIADCTSKKDLVVATTTASEAIMTNTMDLAFSDMDILKELEGNYNVTVDEDTNKVTITMRGIQINPQTTGETQLRSGHLDVYLNGHIEMDKF